MSNSNGSWGLLLFPLFLFFLVDMMLDDDISPKTAPVEVRRPVVVTAVPKPSQPVTVEYRVRFDWVYTGTSDAYREYRGQAILDAKNEKFTRDKPDHQVAGLPISYWLPAATVVSVKRFDGSECKLHVGAVDGAIYCPFAAARPMKSYFLTTKVTRTSSSHYQVLGGLSWLQPPSGKSDESVLKQML